MSARDEILAAIRASKPADVARPDVAGAVAAMPVPGDLTSLFAAAAEAAGARVVIGLRSDLPAVVAETRAAVGRYVSAIDVDHEPSDVTPHAFDDTDVFVCEGQLGVAENGGVWLPQSRLRHRSAVFLARHVVVVLERDRIVPHLHAAYSAIDVSDEGFGVLLAGPSKTSDIEQALVIGAHGAVSVTLLLVPARDGQRGSE